MGGGARTGAEPGVRLIVLAPAFLACDGVIAPLLGLTPTLDRVPWQPSAKELANHVAWTAATEAVLRRGRMVPAA